MTQLIGWLLLALAKTELRKHSSHATRMKSLRLISCLSRQQMMTTTPTIKGSQIQSATMEVMVKMERILAAKADHQVKVVMVQGSSSE